MSSLFFQRLYENELLLTIETCNYIVVWMNFTIMFTETIVAAMHWSMPSGPCWLLQIARILWCIWQRHQGSSTPLIAKTYSDRVALIRCTCSISILEWSMKNYKAPWRSSKQRPHWDTQNRNPGTAPNQNSHQELRQNFSEGWSHASFFISRLAVGSFFLSRSRISSGLRSAFSSSSSWQVANLMDRFGQVCVGQHCGNLASVSSHSYLLGAR